MTDQELADKIVALGVGFHDWGDEPGQASGRYGTVNWHLPKIAHDFVRDWRVTGALMEKVTPLNYRFSINENMWLVEAKFTVRVWNESLPRAINEACVEALT